MMRMAILGAGEQEETPLEVQVLPSRGQHFPPPHSRRNRATEQLPQELVPSLAEGGLKLLPFPFSKATGAGWGGRGLADFGHRIARERDALLFPGGFANMLEGRQIAADGFMTNRFKSFVPEAGKDLGASSIERDPGQSHTAEGGEADLFYRRAFLAGRDLTFIAVEEIA